MTHAKNNAYIKHLRARRAAVRRLVPLDWWCADPWPCRRAQPPLTGRALDGWRGAMLHVLDTSAMPVFPPEMCEALCNGGGPNRALAEQGRAGGTAS